MQFSTQPFKKKGAEIGLPVCVPCHVAHSNPTISARRRDRGRDSCLCFACTDQKFIIFSVLTLLCDSRLPLGEQADVMQLIHIACALRRRCVGKSNNIVTADDVAYLR